MLEGGVGGRRKLGSEAGDRGWWIRGETRAEEEGGSGGDGGQCKGCGNGAGSSSGGGGTGSAAASAARGAAARSLATAAAVAEAAIGLLPRSSVSSHLRGKSLLSFFK